MTGTLVLSLLLALPARAAPAGEAPKVVTLETKDGLVLEADWYPGGEGMPGIVGLHMYPADRSSWKPLAEARPPGFHFLAVDLRGYGGSRVQKGRDLSERVRNRDETLFRAMWQDAAACVEFLRGPAKCDPARIGIVGASVGCSIAIEAAVRDGKVAGVAALSPGANYLGVPTLEHVRSWPAASPLLLLSPEGEADGGARPISGALKGKPGVEMRLVPGGRELHGTLLFGKVEGIEARLSNWFAAALGRQVLDGKVDACEEERTPMSGFALGADPATGEWGGGSFRLGVDAGGVSLSGEAPEGKAHPPGLELWAGEAEIPGPASGGAAGPPAGTRRLRGEASGEGALLRAWIDTWKDGRWSERPLGQVPGTALVRGRVLEARLPWALLGVKAGSRVWIRLRLAGQEMPVICGDRGLEVPE